MGLLGTSDPVKKEEKLIEKGKSSIFNPSEYQLTGQRERARRST
jgi:hypothetical protein